MPPTIYLIGVSELTVQVFETMKNHPDLLSESFFFSFLVYTALTTFRPDLSLFALECINLRAHQRKDPSSPCSPSPPTLRDGSAVSPNLSASDATVVSKYGPDQYERMSYYNGITGDGDHPELVYRSDFLTTPTSPLSHSAESSTPCSIASGTSKDRMVVH